MRNRRLGEVTHADDYIVSDHLVSLIMTQMSENKTISPVLADIFDADGSEIYLKPAADYVRTGVDVSFATVVEAAKRRGECAIGDRQAALSHDATADWGVVVNPAKSSRITFADGDRVVVAAED